MSWRRKAIGIFSTNKEIRAVFKDLLFSISLNRALTTPTSVQLRRGFSKKPTPFRKTSAVILFSEYAWIACEKSAAEIRKSVFGGVDLTSRQLLCRLLGKPCSPQNCILYPVTVVVEECFEPDVESSCILARKALDGVDHGTRSKKCGGNLFISNSEMFLS
jgi:hypothetical protein